MKRRHAQPDITVSDELMPTAHPDHPEHWMYQMHREQALACLRLDPMGREPLAALFTGTVEGQTSENDQKLVGKLLLESMRPGASDLIKRLETLRRESAKEQRDRRFYAAAAYFDLVALLGRNPSKSELRKFMQARREQYTDQPGPGDPGGWSNLWTESGLGALASR